MPQPSENNPTGGLVCPTLRQRKAIDAYIKNGGKPTLAAREAGYKSPEHNGSALFKRPQMKKALHEALERAGLTVDMLAHALSEQVAGRELNEDGTPKKIKVIGKSKEEPIVEIEPPVDFQARGKGLDIAFKLRGDYESEDKGNTGVVIRIQSNVKEAIDVTPTKELPGG